MPPILCAMLVLMLLGLATALAIQPPDPPKPWNIEAVGHDNDFVNQILVTRYIVYRPRNWPSECAAATANHQRGDKRCSLSSVLQIHLYLPIGSGSGGATPPMV